MQEFNDLFGPAAFAEMYPNDVAPEPVLDPNEPRSPYLADVHNPFVDIDFSYLNK